MLAYSQHLYCVPFPGYEESLAGFIRNRMYWRRSRDCECPRSVFQVYGTRQGKKELRRKLKLGLMHLFLSIQPIQDPSEYRQRQQTKGMTLKKDQKNVLCKELSNFGINHNDYSTTVLHGHLIRTSASLR